MKMTELLQLYDEQGEPIIEKGEKAIKVGREGLLHGVSHIWAWRLKNNELQILLQKRSKDMPTWPGYLDISAAGHISFGEDPLSTAVRETSEEIGVKVQANDLRFAGVNRRRLEVPGGEYIENELCWIYTLKLDSETELTGQDSEVESLVWKNLKELKAELSDFEKSQRYVQHGSTYFSLVFEAIEAQL